MRLRKHLDWCGATRSGIKALKVSFQVKLTKMPLVNGGLTGSQSWSKSFQNNIFHVSIANLSYLVIFINFDQVWPRGSKTLILIWLLEQVGINVITKIIELIFQRLFMGQSWS